MITSIGGISTSIPLNHSDIIRKLKALGITPTGNPVVDRARLVEALEARVKELEEKKVEEKKKIEDDEERRVREELEYERRGADTIGWYNRVFLGL